MQISADLVIKNGADSITVGNLPDQSVLVTIASPKTFFRLLPKASRLLSFFRWVRRNNAWLHQNGLVAFIRVRKKEWVILGRKEKPEIQYFTILRNYFKHLFQ